MMPKRKCKNKTNVEKESDPAAVSRTSKRKRIKTDEEVGKPNEENHSLSGYNKKKIMEHLENHGCDATNFENALKGFKLNKKTAMDFFQKHIEEAEQFVYQECESYSFRNISEWLNTFEKYNLHKNCLYEAAAAVNQIIRDEDFPETFELGGIDLKAAYTFIRDALLGHPQNALDEPTSNFLTRELELLIDVANCDDGDTDTKELLRKMDEAVVNSDTKHSLDPFQIEPNIK